MAAVTEEDDTSALRQNYPRSVFSFLEPEEDWSSEDDEMGRATRLVLSRGGPGSSACLLSILILAEPEFYIVRRSASSSPLWPKIYFIVLFNPFPS